MRPELPSLVFSDHALDRMRRRGIQEGMIRHVVAEPEWKNERADGRSEFVGTVKQARPDGTMIQRRFEVVVDELTDPRTVVTAYELPEI